VTRATIVNKKRGEFKLALHRTSLKQKFGLPCEAVVSKSGDRELTIIISKDMPHLALMGNDRLCVINGVEPRSRSECVRILNDSLSLSLSFRRHPMRLHDLTHRIQEIGDDDFEVNEEPECFERLLTCGLCSMLDANGPQERITAHGQFDESHSYYGQPHSRAARPINHELNDYRQSSGRGPITHEMNVYGQSPARSSRGPVNHATGSYNRRPMERQAEVYEYDAHAPPRRHYSSPGQGRAEPSVKARMRMQDHSRDIFRG